MPQGLGPLVTSEAAGVATGSAPPLAGVRVGMALVGRGVIVGGAVGAGVIVAVGRATNPRKLLRRIGSLSPTTYHRAPIPIDQCQNRGDHDTNPGWDRAWRRSATQARNRLERCCIVLASIFGKRARTIQAQICGIGLNHLRRRLTTRQQAELFFFDRLQIGHWNTCLKIDLHQAQSAALTCRM